MLYLLSDNLGVVCRFHFEGTIVGPQVDGVGNASTASFIDLSALRLVSALVSWVQESIAIPSLLTLAQQY